MNRRNFLKRLTGAFAGLALVEAFHLDWLLPQAPEPLTGIDYALSVGKDYTSVAVYDSRRGFSSYAIHAKTLSDEEILKLYQDVYVLNFEECFNQEPGTFYEILNAPEDNNA